MTSHSDSVRRLSDALNKRRTALRLQWQEVTDRANMSTAHLRNVRTGKASLSDLAKAELEEALQWAPGSIDRILEGGDPVEARAVTGSVSLSGTAHLRTEAELPPWLSPEAMRVLLHEIARRLPPDEIRALLKEFTGDQVQDRDRAWLDEIEPVSMEERALIKGVVRALRETAATRTAQDAEKAAQEAERWRAG